MRGFSTEFGGCERQIMDSCLVSDDYTGTAAANFPERLCLVRVSKSER